MIIKDVVVRLKTPWQSLLLRLKPDPIPLEKQTKGAKLDKKDFLLN